jgi:hypothetical protein
MAHVTKVDPDSAFAESTSTGDEMRLESTQPQKRHHKVRAAKGSGLYGPDPNTESTDRFEEGARRRYLSLLAKEKLAQRQEFNGDDEGVLGERR